MQDNGTQVPTESCRLSVRQCQGSFVVGAPHYLGDFFSRHGKCACNLISCFIPLALGCSQLDFKNPSSLFFSENSVPKNSITEMHHLSSARVARISPSQPASKEEEVRITALVLTTDWQRPFSLPPPPFSLDAENSPPPLSLLVPTSPNLGRGLSGSLSYGNRRNFQASSVPEGLDRPVTKGKSKVLW